MDKLLICEFKKQKRNRFIFVSIGLITLYLVFMSYYVNDARGLYSDFTSFYKQCLGYLCFLILPLIIAILCVNVFADEYKSDALKYLWTVPVSKGKLVFAKVLYIELMSLILMLFVCLFVIVSANITRFSQSIDIHSILRVFYLCAANGLIIPLAVFPISIFVVLCKGNTVIPTILSVVYVFLSFLFTSPGAGIIPLSSTTHIIWFNNYEGVMTNNNIEMNVANLSIIFILGIVFTSSLLKKQNL